MKTIRVLIIESHPKVRLALAARLRAAQGIQVVAAKEGVEDGLQAIAELKPDVVLIDSRAAQAPAAGPETTLERLASKPLGLIVLTTYCDERERAALLQAGACYYLLKNVQSELLLDSIADAALASPPKA